MSQYVLNLLVVGASFALYIGIAIWARAGSTSEFYAANRGVNPVMNGMATGADWMSAASFISMAGLISTVGYVNSSYLMGWTGGYVLLALLLAPYLRKFGKFTVPEFIGDRFYSGTARLVADRLPHHHLRHLRDRPDDRRRAWPSPASSKWTSPPAS
jgi:cation/acetate symporter